MRNEEKEGERSENNVKHTKKILFTKKCKLKFPYFFGLVDI